MTKGNMEQDIREVLFSQEEIAGRVQAMGEELYERFVGRDPLFMGVLNGCFIFMADLVRATPLKSELEFVGVSSYGRGTESGTLQLTHALRQDVSGRDIILVEDILDTGNTLAFLRDYLQQQGAASITIVTLIDKPSRRTKVVKADLIGFEVPDEFVVGYGLDYDQKYRNLPYIGILKPEIYNE